MEVILKICVMMEIIGVLLGGYGVCKIVKHKKLDMSSFMFLGGFILTYVFFIMSKYV